MPARYHLSVGAEAVPEVIDSGPLVDHRRTVIQEIVPGSADLAPALYHGAAFLQIVVLCGAVLIDVEPAGCHLSVGLQVVPLSVYLLPARGHGTVLIKIVPDIVDLDPAGLHISVLADIVVDIASVRIGHPEPVVVYHLAIVYIIIAVCVLHPLCLDRSRRACSDPESQTHAEYPGFSSHCYASLPFSLRPPEQGLSNAY